MKKTILTDQMPLNSMLIAQAPNQIPAPETFNIMSEKENITNFITRFLAHSHFVFSIVIRNIMCILKRAPVCKCVCVLCIYMLIFFSSFHRHCCSAQPNLNCTTKKFAERTFLFHLVHVQPT